MRSANCALVTGGGSGIGRATSLILARRLPVVIADLNHAAASETAELVLRGGGTAHAVACDVRDVQDCANAVRAAETLGVLSDVVACAASMAGDGPLLDTPGDRWQELIGINLVGVANVARAALAPMIAGGGGDIVIVGSLAGLQGRRGASAYAASKAGLVGLTRSLVADYGAQGVRANCVCPGSTETPMSRAPARTVPNSAGRRASPEEIANVICALVDDATNWVTGAVIPADSGESAVGPRVFE